jgi:hypothetical protein
MFERITLDRPGGTVNPIDLGLLAECLVFYETVRVIVDHNTFSFLVNSCGPDQLLDLMSMRSLEIEFIENMTAVVSKPIAGQAIYDYVNLGTGSFRYQLVARKTFDQLATGKKANKYFDRFDKLVKRFSYNVEMNEEARKDWVDDVYLRQAAQIYLGLKSPNYVPPSNLEFKMRATSQGFTLSTNIDFAAADADYRAINNISETYVTPSQLLVSLSDTRRDLTIGSSFGSEFAMGPVPSAIAACKFSDLVNKASGGQERISVFQEDVLDDLPNIRGAVNSGTRNFSDVVRLVEQAKRFKEWLRAQDGDDHIRKAYIRDVAHVAWADNLPPKALRWLIFTAAGLALGAAFTNPLTGTVAGTALSVADSFLLDKLIKGWKPSQFIDGPLKDFVQHTTGIITL